MTAQYLVPERLPRRQWLLFAAATAAALVPVYPLLLGAHPLPTIDYLHYIYEFFLPEEPGAIDFAAFFYPNNENFVPLAKVLFLLNLWLADGSNVPLVWLSAALALALACLWRRAMPGGSGQDLLLAAAGGIAIAYLAFPYAGVANFARGFVGVLFIGSTLLAVLAVYLYATGRFYWALAIAAAASLTYTIGHFAWIALLAAAIGLRRPRRQILWLVALTVLVFAVYLSLYHKPFDHPHLNWDPFAVARALGAAVGSIWSKDVSVAHWIGLAGTAIYLGLGTRAMIRGEAVPVFWTAAALIGFAALAAISIGRSAVGVESAFTSRYAVASGLVWACLLALTIAALPETGRMRRGAGGALLILVTLGGLVSWRANVPVIERLADLERGSALGALFLRLDTLQYERPDRLSLGVYELFNWLPAGVRGPLRRAGQYPFTADYRPACRSLGDEITPDAIGGRLPTASGAVSAAWHRPVGVVAWYGWVDPALDADCLLILGPDGRVAGAAWTGFAAPDVRTRLGLRLGARPGWRGISEDSVPASEMRVLVRLRGDDRFLEVGRDAEGACPVPSAAALSAAREVTNDTPMRGAFDQVRPVHPRGAFADGWVDPRDTSFRCVLVANRAGRVIARAVVGFERQDLYRIFGRDHLMMGWRAPVPPEEEAGPYRAYAIDAGGNAWRLR